MQRRSATTSAHATLACRIKRATTTRIETKFELESISLKPNLLKTNPNLTTKPTRFWRLFATVLRAHESGSALPTALPVKRTTPSSLLATRLEELLPLHSLLLSSKMSLVVVNDRSFAYAGAPSSTTEPLIHQAGPAPCGKASMSLGQLVDES
ncbi:unnamed protein product [Phytophthora lilii]|uniref:Unnamed protein product n=1 Tax=Phytophthora lilii TaxID=2077276 RepID=A0A9W6XJP5_9STRA|nr:unnamed protein product [Phytophthora lilii]